MVWKKGTTSVKFEEDTPTLGSYSLGRNKIFIRTPEALGALEQLREAKLHDIAAILQQSWRRYKVCIPINVSIDAGTNFLMVETNFIGTLFGRV